MRKKGKAYWDDRIEEFAQEFAKTDSNLRMEILYKKLHPKLIFMAEVIIKRYVKNYNFSEQQHIIYDAVDDALIRLRTSYDSSKSKCYSFLGMCIKNQMMTKCFYFTKDGKQQFQDSLVRFDDYPEFVDNYYGDYNNTENDVILEAVLVRLRTLLRKAIEENQPLSKNYKPSNNTVKKRRIEYMRHAIDYCEKYGVDNIFNLNRYIQNAMGINENDITLLSKYFFGISSAPQLNNSILDKRERTSSILNDDYCPNVSESRRSMKRKYIRELKLEQIYY